MLNVINAECRNAECRYAECCGAAVTATREKMAEFNRRLSLQKKAKFVKKYSQILRAV
jgi:hypothetical protein